MSDISDAALLERFRSGDEQALEAIFSRYETSLFQLLVGMLRSHKLCRPFSFMTDRT